jgi:hypothetical protein
MTSRKTRRGQLAESLPALMLAMAMVVPAAGARAADPSASQKAVPAEGKAAAPAKAENPCGPSNPCGPAKKKKKKGGSDNPCAPGNPCAPKKG